MANEQEHQHGHSTVIAVKELHKDYILEGGTAVPALRGVNFDVKATDFAIIYGPSGCGKSTMLHILVGLERPTAGEVKIRGTDIGKLSSEERAIFRAEKFGMVYQTSYWIKSLTVLENVALPLLINGTPESKAKKRALRALEEIELDQYANKKPTQLSGGEQQRIGLARALVNNPWIIVADEPTGNLDSHNSDSVMQLLQKLNVESRRTIVMVTHNLIYLPMATRKIAMRDGLVVSTEHEVEETIKQELKGVI